MPDPFYPALAIAPFGIQRFLVRGRGPAGYGMTWTLALIVGPAAGMMLMNAAPGMFWLAFAGLGTLAAALMLADDGRSDPGETASPPAA
jgi:hypothetical protein